MPTFIFIPSAAGASFLLDTYTASVAYSIRQLRTGQTNCIRVRRDNDDAEQDIGFDGSGNLDTSSLASFVGANSAYVVTWYDQSGNGINQTQDAAADQPIIVSSGTNVTASNGIICIDFNGTEYFDANTGTYSESQPITLFSVQQSDTSTATGALISFDGATNEWLNANAANTIDIHMGLVLATTDTFTDGQTYLAYAVANNTSSEVAIDNGTAVTGSAGTNAPGSYVTIGGRGTGGNIIDGKMQEAIVLTGDQSANRTAIATDINNYYSIY